MTSFFKEIINKEIINKNTCESMTTLVVAIYACFCLYQFHVSDKNVQWINYISGVILIYLLFHLFFVEKVEQTIHHTLFIFVISWFFLCQDNENGNGDTIKNDLISLRGQLTSTMAQITAGTARREQLVIILNQLSAKQSDLIKIGAEIIQINPNYLDADLINIIPDPSLTGTGVKKAFDSLRNGYIYLDSRNTIVPNPTTPYMRSYSNPQSGGANKTRKTKR